MKPLALALMACFFLSPPVRAQLDSTKIPRALGKEPRYAAKPKYCLLVFGPDGKDRVWLVRDGDILYADKNGNGDLTDKGERVAGEKDRTNVAFRAGTVSFGKSSHKNLMLYTSRLSEYGEEAKAHPVSKAALAKDKDADLYSVSVEVQVPGLVGAGDGGRLPANARFDGNGPLIFGDSPADAPVIHFGGPIHLRGSTTGVKLYRNVVYDLMMELGTPGVGPGTFASLGYDDLVPKAAFVVIDAEFPPRKPGDPPVKMRYELKERC